MAVTGSLEAHDQHLPPSSGALLQADQVNPRALVVGKDTTRRQMTTIKGQKMMTTVAVSAAPSRLGSKEDMVM